jgi:hypothetical protein
VGSVRADAFLKGAGFEYAVKRDKGTVQSRPFRSSVAFGVREQRRVVEPCEGIDGPAVCLSVVDGQSRRSGIRDQNERKEF